MECKSRSGWRTLLGAGAMLLLIGCAGGEKEKGAVREPAPPPAGQQAGLPAGAPRIPEATFEADPTLLGFTYEDSTLWLKFAPPRGWPPIEAEMLEQTRQAMAQLSLADDRFVSRPVRIFYEKDRRYFMILSEFPKWPIGLDPLAAMPQYLQRAVAQDPDAMVTDRLYRRGDLIVYEISIVNPLAFDLRLIIIRPDRLPVKIDFLVPRPDYDMLNKAIEASIGSLKGL